MLKVDDSAAGPHDASLDHERIVLQARDVRFDWSNLPVHYVPGEVFATHFANVLHLLLP
ncbi:MAG TPA: metal-dependent hydrolase, partial [Mycobacterium sp.]